MRRTADLFVRIFTERSRCVYEGKRTDVAIYLTVAAVAGGLTGCGMDNAEVPVSIPSIMEEDITDLDNIFDNTINYPETNSIGNDNSKGENTDNYGTDGVDAEDMSDTITILISAARRCDFRNPSGAGLWQFFSADV